MIAEKNNKIPTRIFIFGDSIVWGEFDEEKGGWVNRLQVWFRKEYGKFNQVYNLGIPGRTTKSLLDRIEEETKIRKTSSERNYIVVVALSINDAAFLKSLGRNQVDLNEYHSLLRKIIELTGPLVDKVVVIGQGNVVDSIISKGKQADSDYSVHNNEIKKYIEAGKEVCKEEEIIFIDIFGLLEEKDFDDGLHPNASGHKKIFEKVKQELINSMII